jgi:IPT/TIG domain-containing protein
LPAFIPPPTAQFIPKSAVINQVITLNGTNFNVGTIQVRFGAILANIIGAPSATQIAVKVPPGLTPTGVPTGVKVTVSNPGGSVVSDDTFTALPVPAFADPGGQFAPTHGTPGQQVAINGFNFNTGNPQVLFAAVPATIVGAPTATQIVVQTPAGLVPLGQTSADVKISVTTNTGAALSDDIFRAEINIPAPAFVVPPQAQFIPKSGPGGQAVTINGQNFNFGPVTVKFDTVTATVVGAPSATQIATILPAGMIAGGAPPKGVKVTVTTAGGSIVSADTFTVTGP